MTIVLRERGFSQILVLLLILVGIAVTTYAVQQSTHIKPKASENIVLPPSLPVQALKHIPVCPPGPAKEVARCHARVVVNEGGQPEASTSPTGYGPLQFQKAYNLGASSSGRILAIVDAFDHPNIKSDLDLYSSKYGLPILPNCQAAIASSLVPCFQKVDQAGGTSYPSTNSSWALEIALDVEVAHGVCPDCKLLLVEATDNSYDNLMKAVDQVVAMGATVVSNSYGSNEFSSEIDFDSHFNHPGVAFTFSSGDGGYGNSSYPAASKYVTAVGGASLQLNVDSSYASETAWSGTGSGCSLYETKPSWQKDNGCTKRTIADVSADGDPSTGAAVYDSVPYVGQTGWFQVGGTSLASPIIAGAYAIKGVLSGTQANSLPYLNSPSTNLHDVKAGNNGNCNKKYKYLCSGVVGYDGPTGLGTPKGAGGF